MRKTSRSFLRIGALVGILCALASWCWASEITGPEQVPAGSLAAFHAENPAIWQVVPEIYMASVYIDRDGKTLVFASTEEAVVTVVAAWTTDGGPVLAARTFYNGRLQPTPVPTPIPTPSSLAQLVTLHAKKVTGDSTQVEVKAILTTIENLIHGIDAGTIRTAAGARSTFRQLWQRRAIAISPQSVSRWSDFFDAVSPELATDDLKKLRSDFKVMADTLSQCGNGDTK